MCPPEQSFLVLVVKVIEHIGTISLALFLLVDHMQTCRSIRVYLRDLCLDVTLIHWTVGIFEKLDGLAEDFDRVQIRLSFELRVASLFNFLQLPFQRRVVDLFLHLFRYLRLWLLAFFIDFC